MAHRHRFIPAAVLGLLALLIVACSSAEAPAPGDTDSPQGAVTPSPHPLVFNGPEALGASVEALATQTESFTAEFSMSFGVGEFSFSGSGQMAVIEPDQMHMAMQFDMPSMLPFDSGDYTMEMLLVGDEMYIKMFGDQWYTVTLEDLGLDEESLHDLEEAFGGLDYVGFIEAIGGDVEYLGMETADGRELAHYRAHVGVLDMLDFILGAATDDPDAVLSGLAALRDAPDIPMTMDVWLDPFDLLPYRAEMAMEFTVENEAMTTAFSMSFDYESPVNIPAPPADARPMEEMFFDMFGDFGFEDMD